MGGSTSIQVWIVLPEYFEQFSMWGVPSRCTARTFWICFKQDFVLSFNWLTNTQNKNFCTHTIIHTTSTLQCSLTLSYLDLLQWPFWLHLTARLLAILWGFCSVWLLASDWFKIILCLLILHSRLKLTKLATRWPESRRSPLVANCWTIGLDFLFNLAEMQLKSFTDRPATREDLPEDHINPEGSQPAGQTARKPASQEASQPGSKPAGKPANQKASHRTVR